MVAAKKKETPSSVVSWLRSLTAWLLGPGRPMFIVALLFGLFGGGSYLAWRKLRLRILNLPEYRVGLEQIELATPPPSWIHTDIRGDVFRDPRLDGPLSILDDDLVDRVKEAFAQHPWVAKVNHVDKRHPALVKVELVYRQPVCMVEVPGGVLAVDAEGVVLPSEDFSPVEAARYPRLIGVDRKPVGPAGRRWGDAKVVGGAEIADTLGPVWEMLKLRHIVPLAADPSATVAPGEAGRRSMEPFFVLTTRGGTRILWGYAPGAKILGELPAAEKVARLKQRIAEYDALDGAPGQRQELDVRTLSAPMK